MPSKYAFYIEDESEMGVKLSCRHVQDADLYVGQFMLFESVHSGDWVLGSICWLRLKNEDQLLLGLRLLGNDVTSYGWLEEEEEEAENNNTETVLTLGHAQYGNTILLSKREHKIGDTLALKQKRKHLDIALYEKIWGNNLFEQFSYCEPEKES